MLGITALAATTLLWFLYVAVSNERLAARERLAEAWRGYLGVAQQTIDESWSQLFAELDPRGSASQQFANLVKHSDVDGAIVYDKSGRPAYPTLLPKVPREEPLQDERWSAAAAMEFQRNNAHQAAAVYRIIAGGGAGPRETALAQQAEIRCLLKGNDIATALRRFSEMSFAEVTDKRGRSIEAGTLLGLYEASRSEALHQRLVELAGNYGNRIPSSQRRFLMTVLNDFDFPTLQAEDFSSRFLQSESIVNREQIDTRIYSLWNEKARYRLLFDEGKLIQRLESKIKAISDNLAISKSADAGTLISREVGDSMPGWYINVSIDKDTLANSGSENIATYTAVGGVVVFFLAALTWLVALGISRQLRRAQIKHDLASTISHELKTPLSSMRLLIDILLESEKIDETKAREYLSLVSAENARLSLLVENFLAYARIEKGRGRSRVGPISPGGLLNNAADTVGRRYGRSRLKIEVDSDLPDIESDSSALETALLNLADNACKYSDEVVILSCTSPGQNQLCFEVADQGNGLTEAQLARAFESFERIGETDQKVDGCGLGLYIVRHLVDRIGASLEVKSRPGIGTAFTISLPGNSV